MMTGSRMNDLLMALGWTPQGCADRLTLEASIIKRMISGRYLIPDNLAEWLEGCGKFLIENPIPENWGTKYVT